MTPQRVNEIISHAAYGCMAGGTTLVAADYSEGWIIRLGADVLFAVLGYRLGITAIMSWSILFLGVDAYGWLR